MTKKQDGAYEITKNGTYLVKAILENGETLEKEIKINQIDKIPPKDFEITAEATENGLIVKGETRDNEKTTENASSGIDRYEYVVIDGEGKETAYNTSEITGLKARDYKVYAKCYDKAGNFVKTKEIDVKVWNSIYNEEDLINVKNDLEANYILMEDITLTKEWEPIGVDYTNPFKGELNGNRHKITGLEMELNEKRLSGKMYGVFGNIGKEGEIKNLKIEGNININNDIYYIGLLAGRNKGVIQNVQVLGKIEKIDTNETRYVGGLVGGSDDSGIIEKCSSKVEIILEQGTMQHVGGLVGMNDGTIKNCKSSGKVEGSEYVGGLVGYNYGEVQHSYTLAQVKGSENTVGGAFGLQNGIAKKVCWCKETSGVETSTGGTELTLTQMKTKSSYEGWDFESGTVWVMKEYPELVF